MLVADDQPDILEAVRMLGRANGLDVRTATSPAATLAICEAEELDVCLIDLNYARDTTSGREGMDLLARLRELDPALPVVVMTAWGSIEGAVEAIRRGARDYLQKPWDNARLLATLRAQLELRRALLTANRLDAEAARTRRNEQQVVVASSRAMQQVMALVARVAPSNASILVTGEHGTGKEVIARAIHAASARAGRAFVAVNAGGLADGVLDSELFGHVKGAFTDARTDRTGCFELADGGTLFLDEIANMPVGQQTRLLRVLQTGEFHPVGSSRPRRVDVRVLAATNADIPAEAAEGRFREDLLYRLNTVEIRIPPLRERREDIAELAAAFLARAGSARRLSAAAMEALLAHAWPGNVRELEHVLERASLLAVTDEIRVDDLLLRARADHGPRLEEMTLEEVERYLIERALAAQGGNVSEAARVLGLSRSALYRRLAGLRGGT
ncbi:MAG: sigma-54-dependent Fis family transcriptional regulator [Deltaproteobacteria bacterium]|nr:sigma-54-dependent Fis family transcriptional regulator [Deltaproteobacteria bacterium]